MEQNSTPVYLFVYGTLRRSAQHPMHRLLHPVDFLAAGTMTGRLYDLGAYPGAILLDDPKALVHGEVYRLHEPEKTLARLDEYEGCRSTDSPPHEYRRTRQSIRLPDARSLSAWVYLYARPVEGLTPVPTGDWLRRENPGSVFPRPGA